MTSAKSSDLSVTDTFEKNLNADYALCFSDINDLTYALVAQTSQNRNIVDSKSNEKLAQNIKAFHNGKKFGLNLEWDVQQAHVGVLM